MPEPPHASAEELHERTTEMLARVACGEAFAIVVDGRVVARLVPSAPVDIDDDTIAARWARFDDLSRRISERWPVGVSAVEAVREQRRDFGETPPQSPLATGQEDEGDANDEPALDQEAVWDDIERVAAEIGRQWPSDVSVVEAVREQRREL